MSSDDEPIDIAPTGGETRQWRPRFPEIFSGAEVRRQTGPYEAAVPAEIARWDPVIPAVDVADVIEASTALAVFDQYAVTRLGVSNAALGPMSAILLRTESASSSQIEHLTSSAKQLALAEIDEGAKANANTVIGNVRAMEAALALSDRLDQHSILAMHRELLLHQLGLEHEAGKYRDELVWIGNGDSSGPRGAEFIAPHHTRVPAAMGDLVRFCARDDLPVLVQIAVAHAQFETIHPFVDGNGRTGRALAQALLRNKELATHTTVPISAGLLIDTRGYFRALEAYRRGDAGPIVRVFATASRFAAITGRALVDDLYAQLEQARERLAGVRSESAVWDVVPRLIGQPIVNVRYLARALGASDLTVGRALEVLTKRGVLVERTGKARNRIWQHNGMLEVLDEYAAQIRRLGSRAH